MSFKAQPGQIRTCASTHTALMKDEWRKSGCRDKDAEREVVVSTGRGKTGANFSHFFRPR